MKKIIVSWFAVRGHLKVTLAAVAIVVAGSAGAIAVVASSTTVGPIPHDAFAPNATMNVALIPDFVPALDRDGDQAGYVRKEDLGAYNGKADTDPMPVYENDLVTVVGHMYAGIGYVPLGTDAATVPTFQIKTASSPAPDR